VQKNKIRPTMAPPGGVSFYIVLYRETHVHLKRSLSKNHRIDFNQIWKEVYLGNGD